MRIRRFYTPEEEQTLVSSWNAGETAKQIARRINRSPDSILKKAAIMGLQLRKPGITWSSEKAEIFVTDRANGISFSEIARKLGIPRTTIIAMRRRIGTQAAA